MSSRVCKPHSGLYYILYIYTISSPNQDEVAIIRDVVGYAQEVLLREWGIQVLHLAIQEGQYHAVYAAYEEAIRGASTMYIYI